MASKNIAAVLNNESNLRILEKLKVKPFYPRELAGEMGLSEPFIVRRLKAMEEHDIVEGRWESENGRKVKRYYVKDIRMQLGKDGLKVTSAEATPGGKIDMKKEATRFFLRLPLILIIFYGVVSQNAVILSVTCLYCIWLIAMNAALYRNYPYKNIVTGIALLVAGLISMSTILVIRFIPIDLLVDSSLPIGLFYAGIGFFFFMGMIYHIRFSMVEAGEMNADKRELIGSLGSASMAVKLFYMPMALRWKINEYFNLV